MNDTLAPSVYIPALTLVSGPIIRFSQDCFCSRTYPIWLRHLSYYLCDRHSLTISPASLSIYLFRLFQLQFVSILCAKKTDSTPLPEHPSIDPSNLNILLGHKYSPPSYTTQMRPPPSPDLIASTILSAFHSLPARSKPRIRPDGSREWATLAGIALEHGVSLPYDSPIHIYTGKYI